MNEALLSKIQNCPGLPTLPTVAVEVLNLARSSDSDMKQLAAVIERDPALVGRVLKTVNSSFYGRSKKVTTIEQAVVVMGMQSVRTLVLGFSLADGLMKTPAKGFDHLKYWRRSFYAACAAKEIGVAARVMQAEELFVCGLLADIGMLVLDKVVPDEYRDVCDLVVTHAEQAAAEKSLPPVLGEPIRWHADPEKADDGTLQMMTRIVACAGRCADVFVDEEPAGAIADVRTQIGVILEAASGGMHVDRPPAEVADELLGKLNDQVGETCRAFEVDLGSSQRYDKILRDANEALVELTLQSQHQAHTLQQQAANMEAQFAEREAELKKAATTDGLTGLPNRKEFDRFLAEEVAGAAAIGEPLSLIMIDIDRFKSVNDNHGHQVGDAAIQHVAEILDTNCREGDMAARYGGEEMALVLPGTDRATAAAVAEGIRKLIGGSPVKHDEVQLTITASFGVSAYEPPSPLDKPALLIRAADKALYHAKETGRDRVKVFSLPRRAAAA